MSLTSTETLGFPSTGNPLKVFGYTRSPRCLAVLIAAEYSKLPVVLVDTHPAGGKAGFYDEPYHSNFPFGKVPGFSHGTFFLAETSAILSYMSSLNDPLSLAGQGARHQALVSQWVAWATSMAFPTLQPWLDPIRNHGFYDAHAVAIARKSTYDLFAILETFLAEKTFLVEEKLSLDDIMVATVVGRACSFIFDKRFREAHPNVFKHYERVASDPTYVKIAGPIQYIEQEASPPAAVAWQQRMDAEENLKAANLRWVQEAPAMY